MNLSMQTVYLTCAVAGGTVLVIQTVMLIFGGGDHDAGAVSDHPEIGHSGSGEHGGHDGALNLLSIRALRSSSPITPRATPRLVRASAIADR